MDDFDPTDPGTERRRHFNSNEHELASVIGVLQSQIVSMSGKRQTFLMKYWPVFLVVAAFAGSTTTFYFNTLQLGEEMKALKASQPNLVNRVDLEHELRYRDISISNLDNKVIAYQQRSNTQFEKIDKKLDKIQEYMRALSRNGG